MASKIWTKKNWASSQAQGSSPVLDLGYANPHAFRARSMTMLPEPLLQGCFLLWTYVVAAIPFGLVLTTLWGAEGDLRNEGSGNIGATNVARVFGWKLAAPVLVLDAGKGAVPVLIANLWWPQAGPFWLALVAITAFVGHCWSVGAKESPLALAHCWCLRQIVLCWRSPHGVCCCLARAALRWHRWGQPSCLCSPPRRVIPAAYPSYCCWRWGLPQPMRPTFAAW